MSHAATLIARPGARWFAVPCLLLAAYLALAAHDAGRVRDGARLVRSGEFAAALAQSGGVHNAPAAVDADLVRAFAAIGTGNLKLAERAFAAAVARSPNDWSIRRDRALNLLALGRRAAARREMARAVALNPRLELPAGFTR